METGFIYMADSFIQSDFKCIWSIYPHQSTCSLGIEPITRGVGTICKVGVGTLVSAWLMNIKYVM